MNNYKSASERYAALGVDTSAAMKKLAEIPISLHCWQTDDVGGFETSQGDPGGGLAVTGNFPGKAGSIGEVRQDLEKAMSLIPGKLRVNLHANYGDFEGKRVDRDQIEPAHFASWVEWARQQGISLDFNSTFFAHPKADSGFTLSNTDRGIRDFWVEHSRRCREISAFMGARQGEPCVHNVWIPDGSKDETVNRLLHRQLLEESLDRIFEKEMPAGTMADAVESKLFGIGSESFVVGSFEFYLGYAITRKKMLCLDMGHFHPTESVADKVSAVLLYLDKLLFHFSRGIRWDSDHVLTFNDPLKELALELVRSGALGKSALALDFFDASINRIGAYVTGTRAAQKALLFALLEPTGMLRQLEQEGRLFERLALLEELKTMPFGDIWDQYCEMQNVPPADQWITGVVQYEKEILAARS
jgi:L-rhamnose isomerase